MVTFDEGVLKDIGLKILQRRESIALAESVTCGLMQFAFSTIPDASKFLQGGLSAFNIGQKCRHLMVEPLHAMNVNCVSQQVANEMGMQITTLYTSDWGIGVTGYASPAPESDQKLFAYYSIIYRKQIMAKGMIPARGEDPTKVQLYYVNEILAEFLTLL